MTVRPVTVVVREINDDFLNKGLERIKVSLGRAVERNKLAAADRDAAWARIKGTTVMADLAGVDLAIEAAIESLELKKSIFKELDQVARLRLSRGVEDAAKMVPTRTASDAWPTAPAGQKQSRAGQLSGAEIPGTAARPALGARCDAVAGLC